jgi:hypothetical protein
MQLKRNMEMAIIVNKIETYRNEIQMCIVNLFFSLLTY